MKIYFVLFAVGTAFVNVTYTSFGFRGLIMIAKTLTPS
jgi:hypothetical protein